MRLRARRQAAQLSQGTEHVRKPRVAQVILQALRAHVAAWEGRDRSGTCSAGECRRVFKQPRFRQKRAPKCHTEEASAKVTCRPSRSLRGAGRSSAVLPALSLATLSAAAFRSSFTTAWWPFFAANVRAVLSLLLVTSTSAPAISSSVTTAA